MSCKFKEKDCSGLPFKNMPVIGEYNGAKIVKCLNYLHRNWHEEWKDTGKIR